MTDTQRFSDLPVAGSVGGDDYVLGLAGGAPSRVPVNLLGGGGGGGSGLLPVAGTWNMTASTAPATADPAMLHGFTQNATAPHAVQLTPAGPLTGSGFYLAMAGTTAMSLDTHVQQAACTFPAIVSGDNLGIVGLLFTNANATPADVIATVLAGVGTGTCKFTGSLASGFGSTTAEVISTGAPVYANTAGTPAAGVSVHVAVNTATGNLLASFGADTLTNTTLNMPLNLLSAGEGLRCFVLTGWTAATPVLAAGFITYDPSNTDNGQEGLTGAADPAVPVGAADFKVYQVSAAGSWKGFAAALDDLVVFYGSLSALVVLRTPGDGSAIVTEDMLTAALLTAESGPVAGAIASAVAAGVNTEVANRSSAISTAIATELGDRNTAIATAVTAETNRAEVQEGRAQQLAFAAQNGVANILRISNDAQADNINIGYSVLVGPSPTGACAGFQSGTIATVVDQTTTPWTCTGQGVRFCNTLLDTTDSLNVNAVLLQWYPTVFTALSPADEDPVMAPFLALGWHIVTSASGVQGSGAAPQNVSGTIYIDLRLNYDVYEFVATGDIGTLFLGDTTPTAYTSANINRPIKLVLQQDAAGGHSYTFSNVKFAAGSAPVWSTAPNAIDTMDILVRRDGSMLCTGYQIGLA